MKIVFVRHGEGLDDVYQEYGGWNDRGLSPKGVMLAFTLGKELQEFSKDYDVILTSPLLRAKESAEIIGQEMALQVLECPYLKERNGKGLLSGLNRQLAKNEYPDMVKAFEQNEYVPASERYPDFIERVMLLIAFLQKQPYEDIICCTHRYLMIAIIEEILGKRRNSLGDGAILAVEISQKGEISYLGSNNITFQD